MLQWLKTDKTGTPLSVVKYMFLVGFDCRLTQLSRSFILYYGRFAPFEYEKELLLLLKMHCGALKICKVEFSS